MTPGSLASAPVPSAGNTNNHIDKRFVLIQHDFGWNGTFGGPPIRVNKGDVVQITIINAGMMAHNFGIAYTFTIFSQSFTKDYEKK